MDDFIEIKKTDKADDAYKIAEKLHGTYFNKQGLKDILKAVKEEILFAAFKEKQMVGFVTYKKVNVEVIELTWLAVDPENQDEGIGTNLVQQSLKEFSSEYKLCMVKTLGDSDPDEGYTKTRNFYVKLGFIPLENIQPYPGWDPAMPCQIFVKPLQNAC